MSNFDTFVKEQLAIEEVAQEYNRLAPFYNLGNQLILLRKKRGLTQKELAEKGQTTQAVVSRLENVSVHCSLETVVRLAEALDAVVEIHLIPSEDLAQKESPPAKEELAEGKIDLFPGGIFFGQAKEKTRAEITWSAFDPTTSQVSRRKQKFQEFA